jgi:hypothetical protein
MKRKNKNFWLYHVFIDNKKVKTYKTRKGFNKFTDNLIDNRIDYTFKIVANY